MSYGDGRERETDDLRVSRESEVTLTETESLLKGLVGDGCLRIGSSI